MTEIEKSLAMQDRAKKRIPGMTQLLSKRPDMFAAGAWPGYYSKAKGAEVWDLDGNRYLDMSIGGIGANILGYADPDVDEAVIQAIQNGSSSSLNCAEEVALADLFCEIHPWADMVRYGRSGGEAMAIAVRIARAHTGKDKIAFCGYHGWHDWYLAANLNTGTELDAHLIAGLEPNGVPGALANTAFPFRYNHIEELKQIVASHKGELAAIAMEPIRSDSPAEGFLQEVQTIAREAGAVLIVDEVSAGFRINHGGAHLVLDLEPDIAVFSKSIGNGYPIAVILGKENVMQAAQSTFISSTMWTERTGLAASLATIRKHKKHSVHEKLVDTGNKILAGWSALAEKHGLDLHTAGIPPLAHFSFEYPDALKLKAYYIQLMLQKGFLASNLFYAMYAHQDGHTNSYLEAADESFQLIAKTIEDGSIDAQLTCQPSSSGFKRLV